MYTRKITASGPAPEARGRAAQPQERGTPPDAAEAMACTPLAPQLAWAAAWAAACAAACAATWAAAWVVAWVGCGGGCGVGWAAPWLHPEG
eukprot:scaffold77919_cov63-Phaeocystis_antarctica.AAC.3